MVEPAPADIGMEIGHRLHRLGRRLARIQSCLHGSHPFVWKSFCASGWRKVVVSISNPPVREVRKRASGCVDIVTSVGAEAIVIRATPMRSNAAASGIPGRPVILTGPPTALTNAAIVAGSRRPKG